MPTHRLLEEKIRALAMALQQQGLWQKEQPLWVDNYNTGRQLEATDFFCWLQFVYLPNILMYGKKQAEGNNELLMLQARKFLKNQGTKERIIELLVEIDSL